MSAKSETPEHSQIKAEIVSVCNGLGYQAIEEFRGRGWRADVLASKGFEQVAFEVQLGPQSLKKTLDRQERYTRDGVKCCWLFQKPVPKLLDERPDLPLFYVSSQSNNAFSVSLSGRKDLCLRTFIAEFLAGRIRFCEVARAKPEQTIRLVFYEMECWKCKAMNHIYYVDTSFRSACNAVIEPGESLWGSDRQEYRPEIIDAVKQLLKTEQGEHLRLGEVKPRYSKTVGDSYTSFGCYKCDSIFGDWFVMEAEMEAVYGYGQVATFEITIKLQDDVSLPIPHWCYPESQAFCDEI